MIKFKRKLKWFLSIKKNKNISRFSELSDYWNFNFFKTKIVFRFSSPIIKVYFDAMLLLSNTVNNSTISQKVFCLKIFKIKSWVGEDNKPTFHKHLNLYIFRFLEFLRFGWVEGWEQAKCGCLVFFQQKKSFFCFVPKTFFLTAIRQRLF